ncbi:hypothetical protein [Methyloglobulus sp.]|uniref:hypothetical protein n=1 Tax=Methyloglobulus sp. TaxID=2518622 RepID=UPI0032B83DFE
MEWLISIAVVGFLYYHFILAKSGNLKFWKVANAHPEETYVFFKQNSCFAVFDSEPPGGYRANLPSGEWDGPFKFPVPSQNKVVTIYGRSPEYQTAQENFIRSIHG